MTVDHLELRRRIDGHVYRFDRKPHGGGHGHRRRDADVWIVRRPDAGWAVVDPATDEVLGRPWSALPGDAPDSPPEGEWVSRKGDRAYVHELVHGS